MEKPRTHYAKTNGLNIAYQVFGDGEIDLVYVPGWVSNIDFIWEANAGEALISRTVKDLVVGSAFRFSERGTHQLKGVPDTWTLFAATRTEETEPVGRGDALH